LPNALDTVFAPVAPAGCFEFRVGDELATLADGEVSAGAAVRPDVVVTTDAVGFYELFLERRLDGVRIEGERALLEGLLDAATAPRNAAGEPAAA
jgi:hypothetical protein